MAGTDDNEADEKGKGEEGKGPRRPRSLVFFLVIGLMIVFLFFMGKTAVTGPEAARVDVSQYLYLKKHGLIAEAWVKMDTNGQGELRAKVLGKGFAREGRNYEYVYALVPPAYIVDAAGERELREGLEPDKYHFQGPGWGDMLPTLLIQIVPWILLIAFAWWLFMRQLRASGGPGNVLNFGRSHAKFVTQDKVRTTFDDVAGVDEAKEEVREIIEFLKDPQKFSRIGGRIPRGVLLVGPPGTGKTLLAKAIAGEARVPFLQITGSDFVEMFVGVGAARVRDLFSTAKEKSPCIIFIDEIDAVGRRRGTGLGGGHDEREQTLNQILVEMDGFETDEGVIVMAATNRPDVLDPALLRPGRFDRQVYIDLPDVKGREEILKVHAKKVKLTREVDLRRLAKATPMFSGADLANLINEAAIMATMKHKEAVDQAELEEARDKVIWGRQRKSREVIEEERRLAAYHESGHTIVSVSLAPHTDPVHKVTIVPRGRMGGATMHLPDRDRMHMSRQRALASLAVAMGGRVAEEMFLSDISAGASNDIKQATEMARAMVCEWGLSEKMGPVAYSENEEHIFLGRELARTRNVSDETLREIDAEVRRLVDEALTRAREIVTANREKLERVAQALLKYETLTGEEVAKLVAGESIEAEKERELEEVRKREEKRAAERKPDAGWKPTTLPGPQQA
jgi:cell division protease FtsH